MADISQLVISVDSKGVVTATGNLELLNKSGKKTEKTTETLDQSVKKLTKQFERQARNAGKSANEIKILDLKAKGATNTQLKAAQAAMKNAEAMKKQADAARFAAQSAGATGGPFRAMRGSMQQVSWQLQDVAVQAQMGTSAFTILGQQGPQLASIFGPGGAVLGAVIAFGAMLGGVLFSSLTATKDAVKDLDNAMDSLKDRFDELGPAARAYQIVLSNLEIKKQKQIELDKAAELARMDEMQVTGLLTTVIRGLTRDLDEEQKTRLRLKAEIEESQQIQKNEQKIIDGISTSTEDLIKRLKEEKDAIGANSVVLAYQEGVRAGANDEQLRTIVLLAAQNQAIKENIEETDKINASIKKAEEELRSYSQGLYQQLASLTLSGDALYYYKAALKGGTAEQIAANAELLKAIDARKEEVKAIQEQENAVKKLQNEISKSVNQAIDQKKKDEESAKDAAAKMALRGLDQITLLALQQEKERAQLIADLKMKFISRKEYSDAVIGLNRQMADALREIDAKSLEDNKTYLQKWFEQTQETLMNMDAMSANVAQGIETGFADSFGSFLKGTKTAEEAMKGLVVSVGQNMAQMVADMIAQYMAYHVMQRLVGKTTQASEATAMSLNAAAMSQMAGLNAFASTAAIPIVGPAAAPAAMMAALAITAPVAAGVGALSAMATGARALGGQVRGGESYLVGERGPELLTMGTSGRVASNDSLKNAINSDNSNTSNVVNVNFAVQANDTAGFDRLLESRRGQIVNMINQAVNNRGRSSIV